MVFARAKLLTLSLVVAFVCAACIGGNGDTRTVLVDFQHEQFASSFLKYFPDRISVHPGDSLIFRQTWTGEPHSVTMGTYADRYAKMLTPYFKLFAKGGYAALPPEPPKDIKAYEDRYLTNMFDENSGKPNQNGAQPCFLDRGVAPRDTNKPCTKAHQRQPDFTGRQTYYNSGFIPYDGPRGDTYTVKIAPDAKPGTHFFYCNFHGPFMSGFLTIAPKNKKIPSQTTVNQTARKAIDKDAAPLLTAFRQASKGQFEVPQDALQAVQQQGFVKTVNGKNYFDGWFAGLGAEGSDDVSINAFIPKSLHAKVGQKLSWVMIGSHTISFNVPAYFPIMTVAKNGTVSRNAKLDRPAGGAPKPKEQSDGDQSPNIDDAGTWDGHGFWSTGVVDSNNFAVVSVRITKPGTYKFACLIHPPMIGTLVVTQ
jgi:plastocyanin